MDQNTTALERAFELARSGKVATVDALRYRLRAEGYSDATIKGKTLSTQLRALINATQTPKKPVAAESDL
jgi:hypothetical protein